MLLSVLLALAAHRPHAQHNSMRQADAFKQASLIADVNIVGKLASLQARLGPGDSTVRNAEPFFNGWTYWKVRGRDEWVQALWDPAMPVKARRISEVTIDFVHTKTRDPGGIRPSQLGFWGSIQLAGVSPDTLIRELRSLGTPKRRDANTLTWKNSHLEVLAEFDHCHLNEISIQEPLIDE